jgi:hypothetical protein
MNKIKEALVALISSFQQLPYLFIGTGLSKRYSNAPDWEQLLYNIWSSMNGDNLRSFNRLVQKIEYELKNTTPITSDEDKKYYINPLIANELQNQFNNFFFNDEDFCNKLFSTDDFNRIIDNHFDPFKYYVSMLIEKLTLDSTKSDCNELSSLIQNQNKVAGIITTNYDTILESIFPDFNVVIGQDNMLVSNPSDIFNIFKIHGCVTSPDTIVFTNADYSYFDEKLKYLSAKLLTLFVEHPIIFIGYGMGDVNIRKLFKEISLCLTPQQLDKTKNNFIFISPAFDGDEQINMKEVMFDDKKIYMTEFVVKDYSTVYKSLSSIQSSMPIKLARKLQDMVCKYLYSTTTSNTILFGNVNSPDLDDDKAAIYFGTIDTVSEMGFETYTIDDIIQDVLFDDKPLLTNEKLITKTLKALNSRGGRSTLLPVYKYLNKLNLKIDIIPKDYNIIRSFSDISPNRTERDHYVDYTWKFTSLNDILEKYPDHVLKQIANIKAYANIINPDDLRDYLIEHYKNRSFFALGKHSSFKRITALYDYLKYSK